MNDYVLISDGSCDLSLEEAKKLNLLVIPFYIEFGDEPHFKEGSEISTQEFLQKMIDNPQTFPRTSLPSPQDYIEIFESALKEGKDVICFCITTKFSGSYNSATNAKMILAEEYPDRKITIVDTMVNTVLQGLIVREACKLRDNGASYEEVVKAVEENKKTGRIFFTVSGLSYLQNGGRIGKLSSVIGDFLKINPLICLRDGEIYSNGIAISRKRALMKIRDQIVKYLEEVNATPETYCLVVGYGYSKEEGQEFLEMLKKVLPDYEILFSQIGATISVHTGPHPIGVAALKRF